VAHGVVCAGNIVVDILVRPVGEIRWDTTTWVDRIEQGLGGNGANTSFALATLGTAVCLKGMAGIDSFGDWALERLSQAGVETSLVGRCAEPTATTVALIHDNGARAFLHRPGASAEAFPEPVDFTGPLPIACSHFHLANVFGLPRMRMHAGETLASAKRAGLTTSLDTGWDAKGQWMEIAAPCLPHLDLLFVNLDEARHLTGCETAEAAAREFLRRGVRCVVVKLGGEGCMVQSSDYSTCVPAFQVSVVDTTGAGDCFTAGFLSAWLGGESMEAAGEFANAVGALSVQSLGAVTGLLSRQETLTWMDSHRS
jgi:sugar/nucleoside kinase (ribokinase family)